MPSKLLPDLPILSPRSASEWERWLAAHHATSDGVWLRIPRKSSSRSTSLTYSDALDVALCYGWIDGQKRPESASFWLQKFTSRRSRSGWSKRNTEHAERLIREGRMKPSGLAQIETAKKDGRWAAAYDSFASAEVPEDFLKALRKDKRAEAFFKTLNKTNLYSISYRLQTAKRPETRERRMQAILQMMKKGRKFH